MNRRFLYIVVAPTILTAAFLSFVADPQYKSTATLMVTNPSKDTGGFSSFLSGGTGDSMTGAFIVKSFNESWTEYKAMDSTLNLAAIWGKGDYATAYGKIYGSDVALYNYYGRHIKTSLDKKSAILTIDSYAYTPNDALALSSRILGDAQTQINKINAQKDMDFSSAAQKDLDKYRNLVKQDDDKIAQFREKSGYFKPDIDYQSSLVETQSLFSKIAEASAQYKSIVRETPNNPMALQLKDEISSYKTQQDTLFGISKSVTDTAKEYDMLESNRALDKELMLRAASLAQDADLKAVQNHYYFNVISEPSRPGYAQYPKVIIDTLIVFGIMLVIFALTA